MYRYTKWFGRCNYAYRQMIWRKVAFAHRVNRRNTIEDGRKMRANHARANMSATKGKLEKVGHAEIRDPLSFLADVVLAPPCGDRASRGGNGVDCWWMERSIQSVDLQQQFLMSNVDLLFKCVVNENAHKEGGAYSTTVPSLLGTCQLYFNHVDTIAESIVRQNGLLPSDMYSKRVQLLDSSQQLCDQLEQLLLTYASYKVLSVDETLPTNMSHFCIGQRQLGQVKVTTFRYCKPTPYLARIETGLFKRMRWNVETLQDVGRTHKKQAGESEEGAADDRMEYYFLCYEEVPTADVQAEKATRGNNVEKMWSIGKWVQVNPDPSGDINDWILCEVPQASYHRVLHLGSEEPSSSTATDYLKQLLVSEETIK